MNSPCLCGPAGKQDRSSTSIAHKMGWGGVRWDRRWECHQGPAQHLPPLFVLQKPVLGRRYCVPPSPRVPSSQRGRSQQHGPVHPLTACSLPHPARLPIPLAPASTVDCGWRPWSPSLLPPHLTPLWLTSAPSTVQTSPSSPSTLPRSHPSSV